MQAIKKIRNMKVYERLVMGTGLRIDYKSVPTIVLKGEWLRALGFESGEQVQVQCDDGKLTITKASESNAAPPKETAA